MKEKMMIGTIGTVIAISAIVFAACKISGNRNRNTTKSSDLDDFEITEDEDDDEESEEDDDEVKVDSDTYIKMCTPEEAVKNVVEFREEDRTYKPLFLLPDDVKASDLKYAVRTIILENHASIANLYSEHYLSYSAAKSIMDYLEETGCVGRYQKGHSRKLNHNKLKELLNQLDDNCTKCEA